MTEIETNVMGDEIRRCEDCDAILRDDEDDRCACHDDPAAESDVAIYGAGCT